MLDVEKAAACSLAQRPYANTPAELETVFSELALLAASEDVSARLLCASWLGYFATVDLPGAMQIREMFDESPAGQVYYALALFDHGMARFVLGDKV
jgi:hypothetical protein